MDNVVVNTSADETNEFGVVGEARNRHFAACLDPAYSTDRGPLYLAPYSPHPAPHHAPQARARAGRKGGQPQAVTAWGCMEPIRRFLREKYRPQRVFKVRDTVSRLPKYGLDTSWVGQALHMGGGAQLFAVRDWQVEVKLGMAKARRAKPSRAKPSLSTAVPCHAAPNLGGKASTFVFLMRARSEEKDT